MGKKPFLFMTICVTFLSFFQLDSHAQAHQQGEFALTAGIGNSFIGTIFDVVTNSAGVAGDALPVINVIVDYGVLDQISVGLGVSYQRYDIDFDDASGDYVDRVTCVNVGVRSLWHFYQSEALDLYAGIRLGYTNWSATSTNTVAGYDPLDPFTLLSFGIQPLGGVAYYFNENIGGNLELGIVGVYFFGLGLKVRIIPGRMSGF